MMAIDKKQLSEATAIGIKGGAPTDRQSESLDRARAISRRSAALLAAAGEVAPDMAWIVARVAPRSDKAVESRLAVAGIDCWVPVVQVKPKRRAYREASQRQPIERPVWPGYVFIRTAMSPRA